MRSELEVLRDIDGFAPVGGEWRRLDDLLAELWHLGPREEHIPVLFRVFERFPESDGAGVLWSIVHGVESLPCSYEKPLRESLARKSSHMGNIMLQRLERSAST